MYDAKCAGADGYVRQKPEKYGLSSADMSSDEGFQAAIFSNGKETVLAFSGTNGATDMDDNAGAATGNKSSQYEQAVSIAGQVSKAVGGGKLSMTGHSLGGGLAGAAAAATGRSGTTFNAAPVSTATLRSFSLTRSDGQHVRNLYVRGDPVTALPGSAVGRDIPVGSRWGYAGLHPLLLPTVSYRSHTISRVIELLLRSESFHTHLRPVQHTPGMYSRS